MATEKAKPKTLADLVGKEVRIYPGDTRAKTGVIESITEQGVLFTIKTSQCPSYKVGTLHFIAFSGRLDFAEIPAKA
jgi:hypothetical protein